MPKIVVTVAVKDVGDGRHLGDHLRFERQPGLSTWDVADMKAFQASETAVSPEMAAAMEQHRMIPPVTVCTEK